MPFAFLVLVSSFLLCAVLGHLEINENNVASCALQNVNSTAESIMSFEVLQYNVFNRPSELFKDGQKERLQRVPESLLQISKTIDVVTFAEAFIRTQRNEMLARFKTLGFSYSTTILHNPPLLNGGVIIVSKWPIIREAQHVYRDACDGADCLAAKGVKYARLLKTVNGKSKIFNVFATHMQAWSTPKGRADRIQQATQMRQFIKTIGIPNHEPLIFAGDFNADKNNFEDEVAHLMKLLQAHMPRQIGEQLATSDPHTNVLVGRDGGADKCLAQYMQSWGPAKDNVFYPSLSNRSTCKAYTPIVQPDNMCYCSCCSAEWLDYVLYGKAPYQQPSTVPTLQAYVNQVPSFTVDWAASNRDMKMALTQVSDHYPVLGKFEFPVTGKDDDPSTYHLDGCSTDDDCRFRIFSCYCNSSQNCYLNGNKTNGWNLDSEDPVNRNCVYSKSSLQCVCGPK